MKGVGLGVLLGPGSWGQATVCQGQCPPRAVCLPAGVTILSRCTEWTGSGVWVRSRGCWAAAVLALRLNPWGPNQGLLLQERPFPPWGRSPRGTPPGAQAGCSPTQIG